MAVRQSAAEKAAAALAAEPTKPGRVDQLAGVWGAEPIDEFYGHNLTDKADLVGVPFLVIGAEIERREGNDYDGAYVYALDTNGVEFEFYDSSTTGVCAQIQAMLAEKGLPPHAGEGFQKLRTVIRGGLRASDFTVPDAETGKKVKVVSYYLSAAGRKIG